MIDEMLADEEDMVGPQDAYAKLEKRDSSNRNFIVIGPWLHGQWADGDGKSLASIKFDNQPTASYFREEIQAKWFAWYLKGKGDGNFAEAISFQTGSNQWKNYTAWPPKESMLSAFHPGGTVKVSVPVVEYVQVVLRISVQPMRIQARKLLPLLAGMQEGKHRGLLAIA